MNDSTIKNEESINEIEYQCGDCRSWGVNCSPNKTGSEKSDPACVHIELIKRGVERIKKKRKKSKQSAPKKIKVSDLCSDLVGKIVEIDVQIVGQKDQKALPRKVLITCGFCNHAFDIDLLTDKFSIEKNYIDQMIFNNPESILTEYATWRIGDTVCDRGRNKTGHHPMFDVERHMDFAILLVRDMLGNVNTFDDSIHKDNRIYLINKRIPKGKSVKIRGRVVIDPHSNDITIIADMIESLEGEFSKFSITEDDKKNFPEHFKDLNTVGRQIGSDTVGQKRNIAKKAITLDLHSPHTIPDINGNPIRGGLRIVFIGDTKCDKSGLGKDITGMTPTAYRFGEYFIGETGGRTGLTYTIDNENKLLIWGMIPLNDKGLVVIDAMSSLSPIEITQLRETLEMQKVIVRRSQSADAHARTRLLACMNPGKPIKPMNQYLFPCMAIQDSPIFKEPPDISRWDLFIPFAIEDVSQSEIMKRKPSERPIPDDIFKRHIQWVWSREPEHIVYEDEAKKQIINNSIVIVKDYSISSLPIVHNGFRNVLTALSVAYACVEHSTNETHEDIVVKPGHVRKASEFYKEVLDRLGLQDYKLHEEGELNITDNEIIQIHKELGKLEYDILDSIKFESMSSTDLVNKFDVSIKTIKRHYEPLQKYKLIKTKPGKGIELTAKGIKFLKVGIQKDRDMGTKTVPKSIENSEIGTENVPMSLMKNAPPNKKDINDTVKSAVIKDCEISQKDKIDYILNTIRDLDQGHGVFKKSILEFAKDDNMNLSDFDIMKLIEGGILTNLNERVRITEPNKSSQNRG